MLSRRWAPIVCGSLLCLSAALPAGAASPGAIPAILYATFDADEEGFVYLDDVFRGTHEPDYAAGEHIADCGHDGGCLQVALGGVDHEAEGALSGGWQRTLSLGGAADGVVLSFWYRLDQTPAYEWDEYSQVLAAVDGELVGRAPKEYVDHAGGNADTGLAITTRWQRYEVYLGALDAGEHTLLIGGYNNRSTESAEQTDIWIDDVWLTTGNDPPPASDAEVLVAGLDIDQYKLDIQTLSGLGDRCRFSSCAPYTSFEAAYDWVSDELEAMGYTVESHDYTYSGATGSDLYATKVGTVHPDQMYMIGAHLDGRGGGGAADDDGSGCALVLEVARALAGAGVEVDTSVRFIFWDQEEIGLYGSNAYKRDREALQGIEDPPGSGLGCQRFTACE